MLTGKHAYDASKTSTSVDPKAIAVAYLAVVSRVTLKSGQLDDNDHPGLCAVRLRPAGRRVLMKRV